MVSAYLVAGVYCATKFAMRSMTDTLRLELRPFNIKVSCDWDFVREPAQCNAGMHFSCDVRTQRTRKRTNMPLCHCLRSWRLAPALVLLMWCASQVMLVAPGMIETPLWGKTIGNAQEMVKTYKASDELSAVTMVTTGQSD